MAPVQPLWVGTVGDRARQAGGTVRLDGWPRGGEPWTASPERWRDDGVCPKEAQGVHGGNCRRGGAGDGARIFGKELSRSQAQGPRLRPSTPCVQSKGLT